MCNLRRVVKIWQWQLLGLSSEKKIRPWIVVGVPRMKVCPGFKYSQYYVQLFPFQVIGESKYGGRKCVDARSASGDLPVKVKSRLFNTKTRLSQNKAQSHKIFQFWSWERRPISLEEIVFNVEIARSKSGSKSGSATQVYGSTILSTYQISGFRLNVQ